jgi:ABC-type oligopeptide transport system substrate-binding subunit
MKKIYNKISSLELLNKTKQAIFHFSKTEWKIFLILLLTLIGSTIALLVNINNSFLVSVPKRGGEITEGILGSPRFINPVLANTDQDKDLTMLIYSGLTRKNANGEIIPDLASNYQISNDGLKYTFTMRDNIYFHDGEQVTADDIVFTINKIKDPQVRSPKKTAWDGVSIEKVDDKTVVFNLKQPYASFIDNTTVGILPEHLFSDSPIELSPLNENPIGSGPYKVSKLKKTSSGTASYYELKSFSKFVLGEPYINKIILKFYDNENDLIDALSSGNIDQASSISPENAETLKEKGLKIETTILPRIFALFFNHNQNQIFTDKSVVKAINMAIDKDKIVREVLLGYGVAIEDPILPDNFSYQTLEQKKNITHEDNLKNAKEYKKKIIEQTEEITKLKNENTKMIQNMLAWVSVLCVIGIGISLLIGFVLRTPVAFLVASGCAATLGVSIAVTIYMKSIGLVAIICMGVGLLVASVYVIMQIINRDKVVKDLVDTNEIAKQNLTAENKKKVFGGDDKPGLVEEIQSPITKQFVAKIRSVSKKNTKPNNT